MTLRLLPNYFKKIGMGLFLLFFWPSFVDGFIHGYNHPGDSTVQHITPLQEFTFLGIPFFSEPFFEITSIIALVGLIIYALSRDRVFDEFLRELRLEAMHMTFLLSVLLVLGIWIFGPDPDFNGQDLMMIQVIIFLATYKIKKLNAHPAPRTKYE